MKTLIILLATLATLAGCSKATEENTGKSTVTEDQAEFGTPAKPEQPDQVKAKKNTTSAFDAEIQRARKEAATNHRQGYDWSKL